MMMRTLALSSLLILAACTQRGIDNGKLRVDVIDNSVQPMGQQQQPLSPATAYLRNATAQGLVSFDAKGAIIPALASRWIVTDDGLSYIFRLQKLRWNDGRELNSNEIATALSARLSELRDSRIGSELALVDHIVPMTGKVVEIRLSAPMPNLLELLAQPEFALQRRGAGSGPMRARKQGRAMELKRRLDDSEKGVEVARETVTLRARDAAGALARLANNESDLVLGGRFEHLPYLAAAKLKDGALIDPVRGMFGLLIRAEGPFLADRANREALTISLDRQRLLQPFAVETWRAATSLVPEDLPNRAALDAPAWTSLPLEQRQQIARETISRWQLAHGKVRPLRIAIPDGPGGRMLFASLSADFAKIGITAERAEKSASADLHLIDLVADMASPLWYLAQLSCSRRVLCSKEADQAMAEARKTTDRTERMRLLGVAELKLQELRNFIPLAAPLRWSLPREGLLGFSANIRGWHPLQYLGRGTK